MSPMMPGGPRSEREMQAMMRRLGMTTESIDGVEEVVVRTKTQEHVFKAPEVTVLTVKGVRTYQVVGRPEIRPRGVSTSGGSAELPPVGPPEEDVQLVMEQAGVSREEAAEALFRAHGQPAEAILALLARRGSG
jgi:nascent polypeptide-associated complex subunit alpha